MAGKASKQKSTSDLKAYGPGAYPQMSADIGGLGNYNSPSAKKKGVKVKTAAKKGR